jgi:hypothetical protein
MQTSEEEDCFRMELLGLVELGKEKDEGTTCKFNFFTMHTSVELSLSLGSVLLNVLSLSEVTRSAFVSKANFAVCAVVFVVDSSTESSIIVGVSMGWHMVCCENVKLKLVEVDTCPRSY